MTNLYRQTFNPETGAICWPIVRQIAKAKAATEIAHGVQPREAMRWAVNQVRSIAVSLRESHKAQQRFAAMSDGERRKMGLLVDAELAETAIPPNYKLAADLRRQAALLGDLIASARAI